jgi:hypothetical protein
LDRETSHSINWLSKIWIFWRPNARKVIKCSSSSHSFRRGSTKTTSIFFQCMTNLRVLSRGGTNQRLSTFLLIKIGERDWLFYLSVITRFKILSWLRIVKLRTSTLQRFPSKNTKQVSRHRNHHQTKNQNKAKRTPCSRVKVIFWNS